MRFNRLDLNLLVALDALLAEGSITRAAERLNLSQSATSNALARLRDYFEDELLVQVGRRMEPTPRAEGLRGPVRDVLMRVDSTIATQPAFDPAATNRRFRVIASDYTQLVLGPHLMSLAQAQGCMAEIEFCPQISNPQRDLERGEADLLIIPLDYASPDHPCETLLRDAFVCLVWQDSPLAQGSMTRMRYENARHVVMVPPNGGVSSSYESMLVARAGVQRRYAVRTYSFGSVPAMVVGTDYVATVHARMAWSLQNCWPLRIRALPIAMPPMSQGVQWHRYRSQDPGLVWLLNLFRSAVARLDRQILEAPGELPPETWPTLD
ncbi:LysR family transcriptional regulator [Ideonella sp.]|uniref:LysR family transcriptional regulator n=1 Tax=Ideonella sp. TaxID=1929293 RepID=UPI003BB5A380